jgi:hypothetical protein
MLRSCYETDMRFVAGDPRSIRVRWYFVDELTPFLPFETAFYSHNWDSDPKGWNDELGEVVGATRTYADGAPEGNAPGLVVCGTADQFANGLPSYPATPIPTGGLGTPLCCFPASFRTSTWCAALEANLPAGYRIDFTPRAAGPPGVYLTGTPAALLPTGPCTYAGTSAWTLFPSGHVIPVDVVLQVTTDTLQSVTFEPFGLAPAAAYLHTAPWSGLTPITLTGGGTPPGAFAPPAVGLTPVAGPGPVCVSGVGPEWDLYYVNVAAYPGGTYGDRLKPGAYPARASVPCFWAGRAAALRRTSAEGRPVPFTLQIGASRQIRAVFEAIDQLGGPMFVAYLGPAGWDGMATIALLRETATVIPGWVWPLRLQLTWPGAVA